MTKTKKSDRNSVKINPEDKKKAQRRIAGLYANPVILCASSIHSSHNQDDGLDSNALIAELADQVNKVHKGDMSRPEAMLLSQAHTLDALFAELLGRFRLNMGEYFHAAEKYMKLALKAQSQCRTTLEALAEMKNPKPYIQNNQAQYQQVNNGVMNKETNTRTHAHAKKSNGANELLEDKTYEQEWLDTGTAQAASRTDKELATVVT